MAAAGPFRASLTLGTACANAPPGTSRKRPCRHKVAVHCVTRTYPRRFAARNRFGPYHSQKPVTVNSNRAVPVTLE